MKKGLVLLLSILNQLSTATPLQGCLKNSNEETCELCDFLNNYYLNEKQECVNIDLVENCDISDFRGECLICKTNFFLDVNKCVQVGSSQIVENCKYYSASGSNG